MKVVASPVVVHLSDQHYARGYNLLKHIATDDIEIDAYVNRIDSGTELSKPNIHIHTLHADSRLGYYASAFEAARQHLKEGDVDIYHHMNLGYRHFNPLLLTGLQGDTPVLLGPVEAGHDIPLSEFKTVLDRSLNVDMPKWASKAIYQSCKPLLMGVINPLREFLFSKTIQNADRIIAVHPDAKETYARYTDPEKIDVIPYGVDMEKFTFEERGMSHSLVTIGNLIPRKGHQYLVESMSTITSELPDAHLHVIGSGPLLDDLREQTVALNVDDAVTFHGYVTEETLIEYLHSARAFVHPSLSEGFSHARLEAMATGCPVVGTDVAGANYLTRDGTDGFVVSKRSAEALADAVLTLLSDENLAAEMGRNARQKVERDHDYEEIGKRYAEIYRELASTADE